MLKNEGCCKKMVNIAQTETGIYLPGIEGMYRKHCQKISDIKDP